MSDPWTLVGAIVGGGGAGALVAALLVFVTRGAIVTAIRQAGAREIARLTSDLQKERDRDARDGATALETFKAQLTFEAEAHRQVVAARFQAFTSIASHSVALEAGFVELAEAVSDPHLGIEYTEAAMEKIDALCAENAALINRTSHLFSKETADRFKNYAESVGQARNRAYGSRSNETRCDEVWRNVKEECGRLRDFLRNEATP